MHLYLQIYCEYFDCVIHSGTVAVVLGMQILFQHSAGGDVAHRSNLAIAMASYLRPMAINSEAAPWQLPMHVPGKKPALTAVWGT